MKLDLPYKVQVTKKKSFYLNLNQYRNAHFHTLNNAKIAFKEIMASEILKLPKLGKISIRYVLYPRTAAEMDVANTCSIVDKFFCDALVELGIIVDDNYKFLPKVTFEFGEIDKMNPRVEAHIEELEQMKIVFDKAEILEALRQYAGTVMSVPSTSEIVLEATADGTFVATMDMHLGASIAAKATPKVNTRAAVTEALAEPAPEAEKPSLLGSTPRSATKPNIFGKKEEAPVEAPQEAVETPEPEEKETPTEVATEAPAPVVEATEVATEEPKAGTINGDVVEPAKEAPKSIFSFKS